MKSCRHMTNFDISFRNALLQHKNKTYLQIILNKLLFDYRKEQKISMERFEITIHFYLK